MKDDTETSRFALLAGDGAFEPLEDGVRQRVRDFIEAILEEELQAALGRGRYERPADGAMGHRNGHRERRIVATFGPETVKIPRARMIDEDGRASEWRSKALCRYQRLTKKAEALIAAVYPAGASTRRGEAEKAIFQWMIAPPNARAVRPVRRRGEQGRGEPGLAQGQDRLGGVVRAQPG